MPHEMGMDLYDTIQVRDRVISALAIALRTDDIQAAVMSCRDLGVTLEAVQREAGCHYSAGPTIEGTVVQRGIDKLAPFDKPGFLWARDEYERQQG